jgi:signal transduction histidine kinase
LNLLENARDARRADDDTGLVTVHAFQSNGAVFVEVRDRGDGIPPDIIERVFDPHFSTRSLGSGVGLPIVRRLVESWGGSVEIKSELGRGTTVVIRLETS